jgi:hypothetical protein
VVFTLLMPRLRQINSGLTQSGDTAGVKVNIHDFEKLARESISVPKKEIDKRQAQYEKGRKAAKKR